jgi:sigma-E factor negative regulatory protein RseC
MVERARVVDITNNVAKLEIRRASGCGDKCSTCKGGCSSDNTYVEAVNSIGAEKGDFVEVELNTKTFLTAVVLTYGLPLIMLFIGIFTGSTLLRSFGIEVNGDLAGIVLGFGLMALSYLILSLNDKRYNKNGKIKFEITKLL